MFKALGKILKKGAKKVTSLGKDALGQYGFELDENHQRFVLKKTASTLLLDRAKLHSNGVIKSILLEDDHIDVVIQTMGVEITGALSCKRIHIGPEMAQIDLTLVSAAKMVGTSFLGSIVAWVWRSLLGGKLDSISSIEGVEIHGEEIRFRTKAADLELLSLLTGGASPNTTINVQIDSHEIIFTAVEPQNFTPDLRGIVVWLASKRAGNYQSATPD